MAKAKKPAKKKKAPPKKKVAKVLKKIEKLSKKASPKKKAAKVVAKKSVKKAAPKKKVAAKKVVKKVAKKAAKKGVKATKPTPKAKLVDIQQGVQNIPETQVLPTTGKTSTDLTKKTKTTEPKTVQAKVIPSKEKKEAISTVVGGLATAKSKPVAAEYDPNGWSALSDSQKRVFIATAALKHMERNDVAISKGNYLMSKSLTNSMEKLGQRTDFKLMLENANDVACCGGGVLLYADILFRGGYYVYGGNKLYDISMKDIVKRLDFWPEKDLKLIESAFETYWAFSVDQDQSAMPAIIFGQKIIDVKRRMAAILQNVIQNGGSFKP